MAESETAVRVRDVVQRAQGVARRGRDALRTRLGSDAIRYRSAAVSPGTRSELARERGITLLVDVGANAGQYAQRMRDEGYEGRILSFEPLPDAFAELRRAASADPHWECRQVALADFVGTSEIHVAGNSWSSSLLPMTERHEASAPESRYVGTERVEATTLDELASEVVRVDDRIFLKLDVQGSELAVLRGARSLLGQVGVVESELCLYTLYDGQPLLSDIVAHLDEQGFALVSLEPEFRDPRSGQLLALNGLFVRVSGPGAR